jgi:hypothetical protein
LTPAASDGAVTPEPPVLTVPTEGEEPDALSCANALAADTKQSERSRSRFLNFIKHLPVEEGRQSLRAGGVRL